MVASDIADPVPISVAATDSEVWISDFSQASIANCIQLSFVELSMSNLYSRHGCQNIPFQVQQDHYSRIAVIVISALVRKRQQYCQWKQGALTYVGVQLKHPHCSADGRTPVLHGGWKIAWFCLYILYGSSVIKITESISDADINYLHCIDV